MEPSPTTTRYAVRDRSGVLWGTHVRRQTAAGKRMWWEDHEGRKGLLLPVTEMPLYAIERLERSMVVVCEGEASAEALIALDWPAVATVCGAGHTPSPKVLSDLAARGVWLWPDQDAEGIRHMERIAALIERDVAWLRWVVPPLDGRPKGWDAADAAREPDGAELVRRLIDGAALPEMVEATRLDHLRAALGGVFSR